MTKAVKYFWRFFFGCFGLFALLIIIIQFGWLGAMPDLQDIENPTASLASQVFADDGTPIGKYYIEDRVMTD